uniref:Uncharacterized protein n=1 Tax=Aegilops tauschii subsp. strangulata TaxID=200361 RepID=A0A453LAU2_AEGTS
MDASGVYANRKCWHLVQISSCSHRVPHSNPSRRSESMFEPHPSMTAPVECV